MDSEGTEGNRVTERGIQLARWHGLIKLVKLVQYSTNQNICQEGREEKLRRSFKEKTEARMKLLGVTAVDMGNTLGKPKSRVSEALSGETTDAAEALRVRIDRALTGMMDERRRELEDELEAARDHARGSDLHRHRGRDPRRGMDPRNQDVPGVGRGCAADAGAQDREIRIKKKEGKRNGKQAG